MGKAMWLEYFLTISCSRQLLAYCLPSSLKWSSDGGAGDGALGGLDLEAGLAVAGPAPGLLFAGLARDDFHAVGHHEGAVEADAELADEVGILLRVSGELRQEVLGAGAGDGAEVRDQVLLVHADAGVGDGEGLLLLVQFQIDARIEGKRLVGILGEGQVAQLVQRVGGSWR